MAACSELPQEKRQENGNNDCSQPQTESCYAKRKQH